MADALASVIVLGWGGEPYIEACLRALQVQTYASQEVIVVDNASPDRTSDIVERDFPDVKLIRTASNLGVAGGNNVGLRAAKGKIRVLINSDVQVSPDWLERLVQAMESDPTIGVAGAKLLYPNGTIQFAGGCIEGPRGHTCHTGWHEPDSGQWDVFGDVDFVTGASLAITRRALERIGYEDERFFPIDYEDADISYRARSAGFRVVLVPNAVAVHHESSTTGFADLTRQVPLEAGRVRFACKHWSADRLREGFFPAERDFLRKCTALERQVLRWAYLKALGETEDLAGWRERLGVGSKTESLDVLSEVLTQLRRACVPGMATHIPDRRTQIVDAWFAQDRGATATDGRALFLSLCAVDAFVESHQPIGWPDWPPGILAKAVAVLQKVTRRLLRWYVDPIVEQQNALNASFLYALETLAQEVMRLQSQQTPYDASAGSDSSGPKKDE